MEAESKGQNRVATPRRAAVGATKAWLVVWQSGTSRLEEAGKHSVMRRTGISARDLRILDPALSYPSTVVGRERAVVVNLENIKAIVTATEMMILNPRDPAVAPFVRDLENKLSNVQASPSTTPKGIDEGIDESIKGREESPSPSPSKAGISSSKELPFEFRVLEICLQYVCTCLESEASTLEQEAYPALDELCESVSTLNLQRVRVIKSRLVALSIRVQKVRDELEQLLDDDMDMAEMYLTRKLLSQHVQESEPTDESVVHDDDDSDEDGRSNSTANPSGQKPNIQELEMLLDAYFVQLEGALNKLSTLREYVDDTEDFINIILDEKQNELLQIGVVISTAVIILNFGIVIAGVLGMNIHISIFDGVPEQFYALCGGVVAGILILFVIAIMTIRRKGLLG